MKFSEKNIEYYTWNIKTYGALMFGNVVKADFQNREQCMKEIQELISICDNELIDKLLGTENWRAADIT